MQNVKLPDDFPCDECGGQLPQDTAPLEMVWWEIRYFFCKPVCKTNWHMHKLAIEQRKYAGG